MSNKLYLFGHEVIIKEFGCNHNGVHGSRIPNYVNIFVKITNGCNANCAFCSNANAPATCNFNMNKFFHIIDEIFEIGLPINRINITGGEPACVPSRVEQLLHRLESKSYRHIHLHLNTNGLLPASQELMKHPRWNSISVSLHHYVREKLSEIYRIPISQNALQFNGIDRTKVNTSCNLIKGYIDSTSEAHRMMDFCLELGFPRLGFVGLMPVNDYSKKLFVPLSLLHLEEIPHCYFTESRNRGEDCQCCNYLYNHNLNVLEIYMRHYANPHNCESSLLFDGEYLRQGFYNQNIIF